MCFCFSGFLPIDKNAATATIASSATISVTEAFGVPLSILTGYAFSGSGSTT